MGYRVINGKLISVEDFSSYPSRSVNKECINKDKKGFTFKENLDKEVRKNESFTMSNHAVSRLNSRNINLDENDMKEINKGINMALEKGAKESLILYKDVALVASIKNRTIITALDKEQSKGNVFTNIDSVVLL